MSSIFKALKYRKIEKSEAAKKLIWISNFYPLPITLFILCCYSQVPLDLFSYDDLLWMLRIVWQFDAAIWKYYRIWTRGEDFLFTLRKKFHFLSASKYTNNIHFYFIIMPILRSMIRAYKSHMKCHECTLTILYSKLYMHPFLMMSFETLQYFEVQNAYSIFLACGHDT